MVRFNEGFVLTAAHPVPETPVMLATNAQMNRRRDMIGVSRSNCWYQSFVLERVLKANVISGSWQSRNIPSGHIDTHR